MTRYVLKPSVVKEAISMLIEEPIHQMFPGYLAIQQQSAIHQRVDKLPFFYTDFFNQYFRIPGAEKPYFVPFVPTDDSLDGDLWLSNRIAGRFAPSLISDDSPFRKVVTIEKSGSDSPWGLKPEHWNLAKHHLCAGQRISAEALVAFLYRDYAFETENPSAITILNAFVDDFGYEISGRAFTTLYDTGELKIGTDSFSRYD